VSARSRVSSLLLISRCGGGNQNAALIAKNLRLLLVPAAFLASAHRFTINRVSLYGHTARRRFIITAGLNLFAGINKIKMRTNRYWPAGFLLTAN